MKTETPRGLIARVAIQCDCPDTGETGSFLFRGESHRNKQSRVSPVMEDCGLLFSWCRANGWKGYADAYVYEP